MRIGILHGPNLNLLGTREPERYGTTTLPELEAELRDAGAALGAALEFFQSNHEGELIDWVQRARGRLDGLLVNAGGLTHTSVSLRDALLAADVPFVEVHLTNPYAREPFRRTSLLADTALAIVCGFGAQSYRLGLEGLLALLQAR
ncbi:MAG: type II 3-dehydroquinate dehydratase [Gemmatimonadota bacterium]